MRTGQIHRKCYVYTKNETLESDLPELTRLRNLVRPKEGVTNNTPRAEYTGRTRISPQPIQACSSNPYSKVDHLRPPPVKRGSICHPSSPGEETVGMAPNEEEEGDARRDSAQPGIGTLSVESMEMESGLGRDAEDDSVGPWNRKACMYFVLFWALCIFLYILAFGLLRQFLGRPVKA